jgi:prevent-host-death family protein
VATKTVGVREFKNRAPKLVQRAERGEHFVITRHGKVAAVLGPPAPAVAPVVGRPRLREWEGERLAFERLKLKLPRALGGKFVAVSDGVVVDSDTDASALFERVAHRLHGKVFFIGGVGDAEGVVDMPGFSLS